MDKLSELHNLIFTSDLPIEDKYYLLRICSRFNEKHLATLVDLFREKPEWIKKFYLNLKKKEKAFMDSNEKIWNEVIDEEQLNLLRLDIDKH